ncbi:MAG: hypothetical protein HUU26_03470 [Gemmatimonadaceae bacterium]|nr:hypothetical protein [Gemmatimonadaceae bacterium]
MAAITWSRASEDEPRSAPAAKRARGGALAGGRSIRLALVLLLAPVAPATGQGVIAPLPANANAWIEDPCLPDSTDDWGWTRYDLHGIRIRVPPGVRQVKYPSVDELRFRFGSASLRLRLHRNATSLFAEQYTPQRTRHHCWGDVGGLLAEAISLGGGGWYGFAARWPDADRGEWLAAVITGTRVADVTWLRRSLFTIVFPDERR